MKLIEIKELYPKKVQPWMYQTKEEIKEWIKKAHIKAQVGKELTIHCAENSTMLNRFGVKDELLINHNGKLLLPVQFEMSINFDIDGLNIESFIGCPYTIFKDFNFQRIYISNFENFPATLGLARGSSYRSVKNLVGLNDNLKEFCFRTIEGAKIQSCEGLPEGLTGLELSYSNIKEIYEYCPNLTTLGIGGFDGGFSNQYKVPLLGIFKFKNIQNFYTYNKDNNVEEAFKIINKHLKSGRRLRKCKQELEDAGLKEFAGL
jgi:hypothetical protein